MPPTAVYRGYDLRIRSPIAIPGAVLIGTEGTADIEITFGSAGLSRCEARRGGFSRGPEGLHFVSPGVAGFLIAGDHISIEPEHGSEETAIAVRLGATVLPALVSVRGRDLVLHAAGIMLPGSAGCVAICGVSGAGKSSVVKEALRSGARLIGDDTLRLTPQGDALVATGLPGCVFGADPRGRRHRWDIPGDLIADPARLLRVLILGARLTEESARIEPVPPGKALRAVIAQLHRRNAAIVMRRQPAILPALASAAGLDIRMWYRREGAVALSGQERAALFLPAATAG